MIRRESSLYDSLVNDYRRNLLIEALMMNRAIIGRAANALGLHRNSFTRYMVELKIDIRPIYLKVRGKEWTRKMPTRLRKYLPPKGTSAQIIVAAEKLHAIAKGIPLSGLPNSRNVTDTVTR